MRRSRIAATSSMTSSDATVTMRKPRYADLIGLSGSISDAESGPSSSRAVRANRRCLEATVADQSVAVARSGGTCRRPRRRRARARARLDICSRRPADLRHAHPRRDRQRSGEPPPNGYPPPVAAALATVDSSSSNLACGPRAARAAGVRLPHPARKLLEPARHAAADHVDRLGVRSMPNDGHGVQTSGAWKKSSRSAAGDGNCVEIRISADRICIRDSKAEPGGHILTVTRESFANFIDATKSGLFDRPLGGA